jgi:hypothetical protein
MTDTEIEKIVSEILRRHLKQFGFQGAEVHSEIDFDGSPIIRVRALYSDENAPTGAITRSLHDIRNELLDRGEERFVVLEGQYLGAKAVDEDVD